MPQLLHNMDNENPYLRKEVEDANDGGDLEKLLSLLNSNHFRNVMQTFVNSKDNVNFKFWWSYMQMVHILLMFTRAQRDGDWELHLYAFQSMLPLFMRYDHINYARWGTIYVKDMHELPDIVLQEFLQGNFVVKRAALKFNQVDPDQSQEWLNGTGKKGGGIIGITKTSTALSRWALSYNLRSHISTETRGMYNINADEEATVHNESTQGRRKHDNEDEDNLMTALMPLNLFSNNTSPVLQKYYDKGPGHTRNYR